MIYTHSQRPSVNSSHAHAQTSTRGRLPFALIVSISLIRGHQSSHWIVFKVDLIRASGGLMHCPPPRCL